MIVVPERRKKKAAFGEATVSWDISMMDETITFGKIDQASIMQPSLPYFVRNNARTSHSLTEAMTRA